MKPIKYVSNILMLLVAVALISANVSAHAYDGLYNVTGFVLRGDTNARMSGIVITNASNTTQTVTTNASGGYILNVTSNAVAQTLGVAATAGYIKNTSVTYTANNADNSGDVNVTMILVTPTISGVTEAAPTLNGDTISWTVTATDGLNNNYVGSRILYSEDSALASNYFYTGWDNQTTTPSLSLSNLKVYTKYYYQVETYNQLNGAYSGTTTGDFTTKSGVSSTYGQTPTATPTPGSFLPGLGGTSGGNNGLIMLVLIGVVAYYGLFVYGKSGGKKGKKRK
jgi:hypothetical protein